MSVGFDEKHISLTPGVDEGIKNPLVVGRQSRLEQQTAIVVVFLNMEEALCDRTVSVWTKYQLGGELYEPSQWVGIDNKSVIPPVELDGGSVVGVDYPGGTEDLGLVAVDRVEIIEFPQVQVVRLLI